MCVCVCEKERGTERERMERDNGDKSFSCFFSILIFHDSLFEVALIIHLFTLKRMSRNDAKRYEHQPTVIHTPRFAQSNPARHTADKHTVAQSQVLKSS